jgi:hypothetical protein
MLPLRDRYREASFYLTCGMEDRPVEHLGFTKFHRLTGAQMPADLGIVGQLSAEAIVDPGVDAGPHNATAANSGKEPRRSG